MSSEVYEKRKEAVREDARAFARSVGSLLWHKSQDRREMVKESMATSRVHRRYMALKRDTERALAGLFVQRQFELGETPEHWRAVAGIAAGNLYSRRRQCGEMFGIWWQRRWDLSGGLSPTDGELFTAARDAWEASWDAHHEHDHKHRQARRRSKEDT